MIDAEDGFELRLRTYLYGTGIAPVSARSLGIHPSLRLSYVLYSASVCLGGDDGAADVLPLQVELGLDEAWSAARSWP
jgi:hypothetical protein